MLVLQLHGAVSCDPSDPKAPGRRLGAEVHLGRTHGVAKILAYCASVYVQQHLALEAGIWNAQAGAAEPSSVQCSTRRGTAANSQQPRLTGLPLCAQVRPARPCTQTVCQVDDTDHDRIPVTGRLRWPLHTHRLMEATKGARCAVRNVAKPPRDLVRLSRSAAVASQVHGNITKSVCDARLACVHAGPWP